MTAGGTIGGMTTRTRPVFTKLHWAIVEVPDVGVWRQVRAVDEDGTLVLYEQPSGAEVYRFDHASVQRETAKRWTFSDGDTTVTVTKSCGCKSKVSTFDEAA